MRLDRRVRKTYLKIRTIFHKGDCDCKMCIKESLIGRCGVGDRYSISTCEVLVNRFVLFPPYQLWKWFGGRRWFGMTLIERYEGMEKLKKQLQKSYDKMKYKEKKV